MVNARDIYPTAPGDGTLDVHDTRRTAPRNDRFWAKVGALVTSATVAALLFPPEGYWAFGAACVVAAGFALVRTARRIGRDKERWGAWARRRGLAEADRAELASIDLPALAPQLERRWNACYSGLLDDDTKAWLGRTEWFDADDTDWRIGVAAAFVPGLDGLTTDSGSWHSVSFVAVDLGEDVGARFPASTVVAFRTPAAGIPRGWFDDDVVARDERRFEAIRLDETHDIRIDGDHVTWHQLFNADMIDLLMRHPVQWIQQGRWLVLLDPSGEAGRADTVAMDTMAYVAARVAARFGEIQQQSDVARSAAELD